MRYSDDADFLACILTVLSVFLTIVCAPVLGVCVSVELMAASA